MARLGDALRLQREQMGVTLAQAADDTRIRLKFLEAVESGDYQSLPGNVYTKGFLRNYAEYLNLDPDEMVALYVGERGGIEPLRSFAPMRPLVKRSVYSTPAMAANSADSRYTCTVWRLTPMPARKAASALPPMA